MTRLSHKRNATAIKCASEMHDECMKDPEYAARWNALTASLAGLLCDIPETALPPTDRNGDRA